MKNGISKLVRDSFQEIRAETIGIARELWSLAEIGMLEVFGSGCLAEDSAEMNGLAKAYDKAEGIKLLI